jgi:fatty acid desaturase
MKGKTMLYKEPKKEVVVRANGIGFFGLLAIVFITLKLTGYIAWSWWWVLAPLWIPFAVVFGVLFLVFIGALVVNRK